MDQCWLWQTTEQASFGQCSDYIKSSQLICTVNQMIDFYVTRTLILSVFKHQKLIMLTVTSIYRLRVFFLWIGLDFLNLLGANPIK